jgi:hypothetical protein
VAARSRYLYQPERTRALFVEYFRPLIAEAAKPCLQARPSHHNPVPVDARPNVVGRIIFNCAVPQYEKLYAKRCETDFHVSAATAEAALAAYRLDYKRYAVSLSELVPRYLTFVPADPFTDSALLYSPDTGEVHSAGKDIEGKAL